MAASLDARMIQRLPFSHEGTDGDIRRLRVLLGEVFSLAELPFSGKLAVLNLACGRADESGALAAALAPSVILCTSYFDNEHELILASMRARGAQILANVRHAASRPLPDADGKSVDRWVAVFGK